MAEQFIGTEATGVYIGQLVEDMIETVKREKKLYCNVYIPEFFQKTVIILSLMFHFGLCLYRYEKTIRCL